MISLRYAMSEMSMVVLAGVQGVGIVGHDRSTYSCHSLYWHSIPIRPGYSNFLGCSENKLLWGSGCCPVVLCASGNQSLSSPLPLFAFSCMMCLLLETPSHLSDHHIKHVCSISTLHVLISVKQRCETKLQCQPFCGKAYRQSWGLWYPTTNSAKDRKASPVDRTPLFILLPVRLGTPDIRN
jgi:hypothetical protein